MALLGSVGQTWLPGVEDGHFGSDSSEKVLLPPPAKGNILSLKRQRLMFLEVKYQISVPGSEREL